MKSIGQNNKHVTLYLSPIQEHPYHPTSNNTFATLFIGSPPSPRLLVAKTQGENLSLSLWHYEKNHRSPKKIYLHTPSHDTYIPELHSKNKPIATVYSSNLLMSPDKQKAVFLSKSGILLLVDIQTGKVVWKKF